MKISAPISAGTVKSAASKASNCSGNSAASESVDDPRFIVLFPVRANRDSQATQCPATPILCQPSSQNVTDRQCRGDTARTMQEAAAAAGGDCGGGRTVDAGSFPARRKHQALSENMPAGSVSERTP